MSQDTPRKRALREALGCFDVVQSCCGQMTEDGLCCNQPNVSFGSAEEAYRKIAGLLDGQYKTSRLPRRLRHPDIKAEGVYNRPNGPQPQDLRVLWRLMKAGGRIIEYDSLIRAMYEAVGREEPKDPEGLIKNSIYALNTALAPYNQGLRVIETIRGMGYRMAKGAIVPDQWLKEEE